MSFKLQLDVDNATVGELSALLSAARAAGVRDGDALHLDDHLDHRGLHAAGGKASAAAARISTAQFSPGTSLVGARRPHRRGHHPLHHRRPQ